MQGWEYLCSLAPGPSEILRRTNLIRNGRRGATDAPRTSCDAASLSQCLFKDFPHFTELISQLRLYIAGVMSFRHFTVWLCVGSVSISRVHRAALLPPPPPPPSPVIGLDLFMGQQPRLRRWNTGPTC